MGLKFRRRLTIFPGFRLNFSLSGMSATVGPRGANINIGKNGAFLNTGIPGTGIYDRNKIGGEEKPSNKESPKNNFSFELPINIETQSHTIGEIKSYNPELVTSEGFFGLKESIINAKKEKIKLKADYESDKTSKNIARFLLVISYVLIFGIFIKWFKRNYKEKKDICSESKEIYDNFSLEIDFNLDKEILNEYISLRNNFERVCKSVKIWDITTSVSTDRVKTRSSADSTVTRTLVRFSKGTLDFINTKYEALVLKNANGGDIYIYPGFIVMLGSNDMDFGLIDFRDLDIGYHLQKFVEEEIVPNDTKIVDRTWKYVNKNGMPDRRFSNNNEIPIALYCETKFNSTSGMNECYQISNPETGMAFCDSLNKYMDILSKLNWSKAKLIENS